jgi:hypothetical protein
MFSFYFLFFIFSFTFFLLIFLFYLSSPFPLFSTITAPPLSIRALQPHDLSPMRARPAAVSSPPGSPHPPPPATHPVVDLPRSGPRRPPPRAELTRRPWWRFGRSSPAGHGGGSRGARLPPVPSPPTAPAGL